MIREAWRISRKKEKSFFNHIVQVWLNNVRTQGEGVWHPPTPRAVASPLEKRSSAFFRYAFLFIVSLHKRWSAIGSPLNKHAVVCVPHPESSERRLPI